MNTPPPLEVKVIFDASSRGRRRPSRTVSRPQRVSRPSPWIVLGLLNFLAAGGLYYTTWWYADPHIYMTLLMKTPDRSLGKLAGILAGSGGPETAITVNGASQSEQPRAGQFDPSTAQWLIPATAYGWLTLATVAACALATSAGAAIGRIGGSRGRRIGTLLALTMALVLAVAAFIVWNQFGWKYLPDHLRWGMGGLVALSALIGLAVGRAARGLAYVGAITLILSAVGTVVGLILGSQCGAIPPAQSAPLFLLLVFLIHSSYGWIQLPILSRLSR